MNKKQMSEALAAEYEAWLAGKAQPSALFKPPAPKRPSPVTPKIEPVKKPKTVKPPKIVAKRVKKPKKPNIAVEVIGLLTEPMQPVQVAQIISEQLKVSQTSVLNVIAQLVKDGRVYSRPVRLPARVATVIALESVADVAQIEKRGYAEHFKVVIDAVGAGARQADVARKLNLSRSDARGRLMRLVEIGILRREGMRYESV